MSKSGEIFIRAGIVTARQLEKIYEEQARTPGTNLGSLIVASGLATDRDVASAFASQLKMPVVEIGRRTVPGELLALVDAGFAHRYGVVPLAKRGKSVELAMVDPLDFDAVQSAEFKLGASVIPVVAVASDLAEALHRLYPRAGDEAETAPRSRSRSERGERAERARRGESAERPARPRKGATEGSSRILVRADNVRRQSGAVPALRVKAPEETELEDADEQLLAEVVAQLESEGDRSVRPKGDGEPPIVRVVNLIFQKAVRMHASDVHLEPGEALLNVRFRIDGILHNIMPMRSALSGAIVSRIKIMAALDISEKRLPQDGKLKLATKGKQLDVRVSTLPTRFGEKVVLRILNTGSNLATLEEIGLMPGSFRTLYGFTQLKQGLVLVTGPTGSGKTTTLYAFIKELLRRNLNILTFEDPIEYQIAGVNQVQINERASLTFATGLRSALRQDPDVIMVGEIRDRETLEIALQAAITGHLVLSTIHTNDAASTIARLRHLGARGFQISAGLCGVGAQRLVRAICPSCRTEAAPDPGSLQRLRERLSIELPQVFYRGAGCGDCGGTGYRGRLGVYELLPVDAAIKNLIVMDAPIVHLQERAVEAGMVPMAHDCVEKVRHGLTSLEELERVFVLEESSSERCSGCSRMLSPEFTVCPYCGHLVSHVCASCNRELDPQWSICPYCRTSVPRSEGEVAAKASPATSAPPATPPPTAAAPSATSAITVPVHPRPSPERALLTGRTMELPIWGSDTARLASAAGEDETIFLVHGDPITSLGFEAALAGHGLKVQVAQDGYRALAEALGGARPGAIVMDAGCLATGGQELVRAVRSGARNIPVILLASSATDEDRWLAVAYGVDDVLDRPVTPDELHERLRLALHRIHG